MSYEEIQKTRDDLRCLVFWLNVFNAGKVKMLANEMSVHIEMYTSVLRDLGKNGVLYDIDMIHGIKKTQKLIVAINKEKG